MYYVSRQHLWPEGQYAVEVVSGGSDNSSPDMLTPYYPGEGEEYDSPIEAVEEAIAILHAWQRDFPDEDIVLVGFTTGYGLCVPEEASEEEARAWAKKVNESIPCCDYCGDKMYREQDIIRYWDLEDEYFCSEYCAESRYADVFPPEEEED